MNWVLAKYYYIINFRYFDRPRIYPVYFVNRHAAKRAIQQNIPSKKARVYYSVIRGKKLKKFQCRYVLRLGHLKKFTKYQYSPELETIQKRKSFRTKFRRRLRRMGMLTLVKSQRKINAPNQIIKPIRNRQEVAWNMKTEAVVFQIEGKNRNEYYIILGRQPSWKRGKLFYLRTLKVNTQEKTVCIQNLHTKRKDILIPRLITEILKDYDKLGKLRKGTFEINPKKAKKVLKVLPKKLV